MTDFSYFSIVDATQDNESKIQFYATISCHRYVNIFSSKFHNANNHPKVKFKIFPSHRILFYVHGCSRN